MTKNIFSVAQVNHYIRDKFEKDFFLHWISIKGEVSNCKYHSSGNIYFTIKDAQSAMSAVMFSGDRKGLDFRMKEGDKIIVTGSVMVFERDGKYQIYARQIELDGAGNLFLQYEALKKELEEMGMFASEYKQPIPKYARRIGVVTAPTGAAIQDIRNIATRRNPYVQIILYPALVQGDGAAESIVNGIYALEHLDVDVIIVGRGGGSIEDLWAFNEEIVARAIFDCSIPIISAVGHETDTTIADYVADLRAPTPSAAAELAVYDYRQTMMEIDRIEQRMQMILMRKLDIAKERLSHYQTRVNYLNPQNRLKENRHRLLEYEECLGRLIEAGIKDRRQRLLYLSQQLEVYSPLRKLQQGYSYVELQSKKALKSIEQVTLGEDITVHVMDGEVVATVSEVKQNEG